jgi:ADP-heptose:LPS heptosyltransferase
MCTPSFRALGELGCRIRFYTQHPELITGLSYIEEVRPLDAAPSNAIFVGYGVVPPYSHIAQIIGHELGVNLLDVRPDCVIQPDLVRRFQDAWQDLPHPHIIVSRRAGFYTRNKDWPDAHWQELIHRLTADTTIIEIGAPSVEASSLPQRNYVNLIGRTPIEELIAAIAAADFHIGPVSGPMHIAAAARKPSVVICGGYEHPKCTSYPGNVAFYTPVPCASCWLREPCPYGLRCLEVISPGQVEKAARDTWSKLGDRSR